MRPDAAKAPKGDDRDAHGRKFDTVRGTEGYWRIARDSAGVWWFLSPDGRPEFLNLVTTVQPALRGQDPVGPDFLSRDWNGSTRRQDLHGWAVATLARVHSTGFKGVGAWSNPIFHELDVPMSRDLNVSKSIHKIYHREFSPEWVAAAEEVIRAQVEPLRENRNLVGYYTDNELDWGDVASGPATYFDFLSRDDANRSEVIGVIRSLWATPADFNRDWKAHLRDWDELNTLWRLPRESETAYSRLGSAWLTHLAGHYFRVTTALVHKHDPNHLILGIRFRGAAPREVVQASRGYTDAQSLNYYPGDARLAAGTFRMMSELSGQPLIVSEYSFHALDGRSGNRNTVGFTGQVRDQQARAAGYRLFTTRLARVPYIIGADWFQWMDEPPAGRIGDGEDVNFGIVDVHDRPYGLLERAVSETTPRLNTLHGTSPRDDQLDVWREDYAGGSKRGAVESGDPIATAE